MKTETVPIEWHKKKLEIFTYSRESGDECIIFIHGLGCSGKNISSIFEYRQFKNYSILSFDLPGHGQTPANPDYTYKLEDHMEVCLKLIQRSNAKKFHLIGHSMGGAIGTIMADQNQDLFETFINIEGNMLPSDSWLSRKAVSIPYEEFLSVMRSGIIMAAMNANDAGGREWASCAEKSDPEAFYRSSVSLVHWSESKLLFYKFKSLKIKKVYVTGYKSLSKEVVKELDAERIPKIIIPDSGHFPMIDNPAFFYDEISSFLINRDIESFL